MAEFGAAGVGAGGGSVEVGEGATLAFVEGLEGGEVLLLVGARALG